jgi:ribonucleoside-diphosphate reductase alpha chain
MPDNYGYLNVCSAIQRYMDMSMSVNQYFNPNNFADGKISYAQIIKEIIHFYKNGGKSLYYLYTDDLNQQFDDKSGCASGACAL